MRLKHANSRTHQRRQVRYIAAALEDLIHEGNERNELNLILTRARGEIVGLLRSEEDILSEHESLAG